MKPRRFSITPAIHLILKKNQHILLQRRSKTGYMDGWYGLPSGHLENRESIFAGMIREVNEEIGVKVTGDDLFLKLTMHRLDIDSQYIDWFFECYSWNGEISNKEPEKCSELKFFSLNDLPNNTIPYVIFAIESIDKKQTFIEYGF